MWETLQEWTATWPQPLTALWWTDGRGDSNTGEWPPLGPTARSQRQAVAKQAAGQVDAWLGPASGRSARAARIAVRAGLLLWHDLLDESHSESQSIEGEGPFHLGDYWHAIMHRREPDYGNARYWLRRVGPHPVHDALSTQIPALKRELLSICGETPEVKNWLERVASSRWNADAMVSLCETCARRPEGDGLVRLGEWLQALEMTLLMDESLRAA